MSTQLQLRKGNTAQTQIFTGAVAEVTVDTDQDTLVVHDGTTVGGHYVISKQQFTQNVAAINSFAQGAYNKANTGGTFTGNVIVSQNLNVLGDLTVTGNVTTENVYSFTVVDPLIQLGVGNYTSDLKDIGFASHYNAGTNAHTGLIRDTGTKEYYFFQGYTPILDSNNNVVITDPSFSKANVQADYFKGNLIANTVVVNGVNSLGEKLIINQAYDYGTGRVQITGNTFVVGDLISSDYHAQGGTNFYRQSTNIANTSIWNYTNATPIANSSVAPDFTNTGVKINEGSSNNWHGIETVNAVDKFRYYTHSIYAKASERNYLFVRFNTGANAHITFDLANGVYTQEANSDINWIGIFDAGNGWYRCATSVNTGDSTSLTILTGPTITPGLIDDEYQGVNGYGVHVWHPQLEYGRRPSQFTATANTIVQQENDVVVESGTLIAHQGEIVSLNVGSQTIADTLQVDGNSNLEDVTATGTVVITNTQDSVSNSTGALTVVGGIGVKGNVYFGSHGALLDTPAGIEVRTTVNETIVLRAFNIPFTFNPSGTIQLPSGGDVVDSSGNTVTTLQGVTSRGSTTTNQIGLTGGKNSSNVGTGDLLVTGGVGVAGNVYAGAIYSDNHYTLDKVPLIQPVNQFAQNAYNKANAAFTSSNAVNQYATSAYAAANTNASNITIIQGVDLTQNTNITTANNAAWAGFAKANAALANTTGTFNGTLTVTGSVITLGSSGTGNISGANTIYANRFVANSSFYTFADGSTQNVAASPANYTQSAFNTANSAFAQANAVNGFAQGAYNTANAALTGASFSGTANSIIATDGTGALYNSNAKFLAANNTLISSNVNVDGTLTVAVKKTSGGVFTSDTSGVPVALDSWLTSEFRTVIYNYTVTAAVGYQFHQLVLVQDDFTANLLVTVETVPTGKIADYSASLVNGVVTLYANTQSSATFTYTRDAFLNTGSNILPTDLQFGTASAVDLGVGIVDNPLIDLNAL
jgi:hypothetical protein